jgi:hypothetical protein
MTITLTRKEAQQLLEVFELFLEEAEDVTTLENNLVKMLRARLAQPEPEPVATVWVQAGDIQSQIRPGLPPGTKLYTAPPQRNWQGLTDDERTYLAWESNNGPHCVAMTEAKLKEKNA